MNKRMIIILTITILVLAALFGGKWYSKRMMGEYLAAMGQAPVTVSSADASFIEWQQQVSAVGTLFAIEGADLTTEVSGIVDAIHFENGANVVAGDIIINLNSATHRAELQSLEAAARLAEIERDRVGSLWKLKSIAKSQFDKRETELDQALAQLKAQKARLEQTLLRAPFDGRLGIRIVNVGQFLAAGDPVIALQSLDSLYLNFTLPEERYREIHVGQSVDILVDALSGDSFTGKVTAIEPSIEKMTRNFNVQATFENKSHNLLPGMFARVSVSLGEPIQRIVIPRTAISYNPYGNSVFILSRGKGKQLTATQRFVQTGEERGDLVSAEKGLEVGETVASSGLLKLRNGSIVTINNAVQPEATANPAPHNE